MLEFHLITLLLTLYVRVSDQHGFLSWPPQRSSLWRHGFDSPINYNDNALWCGGLPYFKQVGEKCGTCGDSYYGPHEHEAGGKYGLGIIGARYPEGTTSLLVTVTVNAYHKGFFEFKICPHNNPLAPVQQECLDQYPLKVREAKKDKDGFKYYPPKGGELELTVELPKGIHCSQCVLQWKYKTGNSWGKDRDGNSCLGCGAQEQFQNCADISIGYDAPPEEQQTMGFTKRSVTLTIGHTLSPRPVTRDLVMGRGKDANTNTLSPTGQFVVHSQNIVTTSPMYDHAPPEVPEKIDISGLTLTGHLQQLLSKQTLSLTNPPPPPLYMTQWTTKQPSGPDAKHGPKKQSTKTDKKKGHSRRSENQISKNQNISSPIRKSRWRNVSVHTTKNTGSLLSDHNEPGMVISAPQSPSNSILGKLPHAAVGGNPKPAAVPTAVPTEIKTANLLLDVLTTDKQKPALQKQGTGVRKARTKPMKKLTRKQRRRAERLARKQREEAKKAERLARRRAKTASRRRSRRRRVNSRMDVSTHNVLPEPATTTSTPPRGVKYHESHGADRAAGALSSAQPMSSKSSSLLRLINKLKEKLLGTSPDQIDHNSGSSMSSSISYSKAESVSSLSQPRYPLPQSTVKNQRKNGQKLSPEVQRRLLKGLRVAIKMAESSGVEPGVLKSIKDLLNDFVKRNPSLV
ncbi:uncharacterized protein [Argopecten irradians]|uniref:uncharacterized protein n=1 Tax=Argopecten irradians TaxID=31199 RepID=UPI00371E81AA